MAFFFMLGGFFYHIFISGLLLLDSYSHFTHKYLMFNYNIVLSYTLKYYEYL